MSFNYSGTSPDPIDALITWATNNLQYTDDDGNVQTPTTDPPGLDVLQWLEAEKHVEGIPRVVIGPLSQSQATPYNIGASPQSRNQYDHSVELHLETIRCQVPNVSGYNAKIALTECIQDALVQHRGDIDGTGNFFWTELMAGPKDASDSDPATDYYHVLFIISVRRQKVR